MKNISTLRNHLFDQLERLAQSNTKEEMDMELQKATKIIEVSDALLRTAQVEAAIMDSVKVLNSAFIPDIIQEITINQEERSKKSVEFNKPTKELIDNFINKNESQPQ